MVGLSPDPVSEDVIVLGFKQSTNEESRWFGVDKFDPEPRSIHYFKLQYRYTPREAGYDETPFEIPPHRLGDEK